MKFQLLLLFSVVALATAGKARYDGYKVYRLFPMRQSQLEILKSLNEHFGADIWNEIRSVWSSVDVMVPPETQSMFTSIISDADIPNYVMIQDVQKTLNQEELEQRRPSIPNNYITFDKYYRIDEINAYMDQLASKYPSLVRVSTFGKTTEGRNMRVLSICSSGTCGNKPAVVIDGGIHAREWIAPAQVLYIINQLVENSAQNKEFIEKLDWYITPVLNPDGYEYTHTTSRFWRKTRSYDSNTRCYGVDPNRNFGFQWGGGGTSPNPCSDTYKGTRAFSEPETAAWSEFGLKVKNKAKLYLTFHSYGNYILYPWGYTSNLPADWRELQDLGDAVNAKLGNKYTVGSSTNVLYIAAGGSDDWFKGGAGVQLSYTIELPGGGSQGFDPPPSKIRPIVTETYEGFKVFANYVIEKFT